MTTAAGMMLPDVIGEPDRTDKPVDGCELHEQVMQLLRTSDWRVCRSARAS